MMRAAIAAVLLAAAAASGAQEIKLPPADEGTADATWLRFKARLLEALARRDHKFVLGIIDGGIRNISEKSGAAEFKKLWEPQSADSPLWVELPKILFLGGVFVKSVKGPTEFCAPYVYYKWPDHAPADASGDSSGLTGLPAATSALMFLEMALRDDPLTSGISPSYSSGSQSRPCRRFHLLPLESVQ